VEFDKYFKEFPYRTWRDKRYVINVWSEESEKFIKEDMLKVFKRFNVSVFNVDWMEGSLERVYCKQLEKTLDILDNVKDTWRLVVVLYDLFWLGLETLLFYRNYKNRIFRIFGFVDKGSWDEFGIVRKCFGDSGKLLEISRFGLIDRIFCHSKNLKKKFIKKKDGYEVESHKIKVLDMFYFDKQYENQSKDNLVIFPYPQDLVYGFELFLRLKEEFKELKSYEFLIDSEMRLLDRAKVVISFKRSNTVDYRLLEAIKHNVLCIVPRYNDVYRGFPSALRFNRYNECRETLLKVIEGGEYFNLLNIQEKFKRRLSRNKGVLDFLNEIKMSV